MIKRSAIIFIILAAICQTISARDFMDTEFYCSYGFQKFSLILKSDGTFHQTESAIMEDIKGTYQLGEKDGYPVVSFKGTRTGMNDPETKVEYTRRYYFKEGSPSVFCLYDEKNLYGVYGDDSDFRIIIGYYETDSHIVEETSRDDRYDGSRLGSFNIGLPDYPDFYFLWAEGESGDGTGTSVHFSEWYETGTVMPFSYVTENIEGVVVLNGIIYGSYKNKPLYEMNNRVAELKLEGTDHLGEANSSDPATVYSEKLSLADTPTPQCVYLQENIYCTGIRATISKIYKGSKWNDTCLTRLIYFTTQPIEWSHYDIDMDEMM